MTLIVKKIDNEDKQSIYHLVDAVNKTDHLGYSLTEEWFDYVIDEAGEGILVGYYDDQIIGLATCIMNPVDRSQATLNVVIHPKFRKQGFGTCLYNKIIEYTKEQQVKTVETYVKKRLDDAVRFAEKRSFQVILYSWQMELEIGEKFEDNHFNNEVKNEIIFRKTTGADGKDYARVMNECFGDEIEENTLKQLLNDPSVSVYMLEDQGEVIGSITMQLRKKLSLGYIYDVAVMKNYRGKGLGSYLLQQCILELKEHGIKTASLMVAGKNKNALGLYEKAGFKAVDMDMIIQKII